jgi:hypothetical protein
MRLIAAIIAAAYAMATPVLAQVPADPEDTVVEELTSNALLKGPPWWKAEKNGRMVYIFGLPTTSPSDLDWDQRLVGWRMNRAQRIILPAQYETDVDEKRFNLAAVLPPETAARVEAARIRLGAPPTRYQRVAPLAVAARMSEDLRKAFGLEWEAGYRGFHNQAALRLLTRKVDTGLWEPAGPVNMETQIACLESMLEAVEAGPDAYRRAAEAWAVGDIKGALSGPRGDRWWRCAAPNMDVIVRYVSEIEAAVAHPRVEVVVAGIPVHSLVARDGVVQRLQAAGYTITEPSGLAETR